jgi:pSer/pThr/pTyr-binding forkhead associated (FHA) protein
MPYCTHCGHDNPDGSNFCANCGAALPTSTKPEPEGTAAPSGDTTKTIPVVAEDRDADALSPEEEAAVKALPGGSALLVVQRGSNAGSRFLLNKDVVTAGRHQSSDIFLDDISVSRRHAVLVRSPEGVVVKDQGSLNGTYVNRNLVDECRLKHGDEVQIGKFRLVYFASPADAE